MVGPGAEVQFFHGCFEQFGGFVIELTELCYPFSIELAVGVTGLFCERLEALLLLYSGVCDALFDGFLLLQVVFLGYLGEVLKQGG